MPPPQVIGPREDDELAIPIEIFAFDQLFHKPEKIRHSSLAARFNSRPQLRHCARRLALSTPQPAQRLYMARAKRCVTQALAIRIAAMMTRPTMVSVVSPIAIFDARAISILIGLVGSFKLKLSPSRT